MSLEVILQDLMTKVPQAIGVILVDWEGEAVIEHCHCDPYDMRFIGAHKVLILTRLREMRGRSESDTIEDMVITASEMHVITGCIDKDYALVMTVEPTCPVALALRHFRGAVAELKKEI